MSQKKKFKFQFQNIKIKNHILILKRINSLKHTHGYAENGEGESGVEIWWCGWNEGFENQSKFVFKNSKQKSHLNKKTPPPQQPTAEPHPRNQESHRLSEIIADSLVGHFPGEDLGNVFGKYQIC